MTTPFDDPDHRPEALKRLGEDPTMSSALEDRVVQSLRASGTLRQSRRWRTWPLAAAAALACFLLGRQTAPARTVGASDTPGHKWMLLLYEDATFQGPTPGSEQEYVAEYRDWALNLRASKQLLDAAELLPARALLEPGGATQQTAGASNLGSLTGYFIILAPTLEEARAIAQTNPHLKHGGRVAIQPLGAS